MANHEEVVARFSQSRVLVVGDLFLDRYLWGHSRRSAPDTTVPVIEVEAEMVAPGGAANVAANIASLGGSAVLVGAVGTDNTGDVLLDRLKQLKVDCSGILRSPNLRSIEKIRIYSQGNYLVRVDREQPIVLSTEACDALHRQLAHLVPSCEAVIVSDYAKGLVTRSLLTFLKSFGRPIFVDPKVENMADYQGVTLLSPNQRELEDASGFPIVDDQSLENAAIALQRRLACPWLLCTLGPKGCLLVNEGRRFVYQAARSVEVREVSGAGDTLLAAFVLAFSQGVSPENALDLALLAASLAVGKDGTSCVKSSEILRAIKME